MGKKHEQSSGALMQTTRDASSKCECCKLAIPTAIHRSDVLKRNNSSRLDWKHLHTSPFLTYIETEIQALGKLTENNCQSTPRFYGSMICIQNIPDPNPGAVTSFIAMEDVPGTVYDWTGFWSTTTLWERAQKRAAFRKAYQYVDIYE
jgi:hypothetical protein